MVKFSGVLKKHDLQKTDAFAVHVKRTAGHIKEFSWVACMGRRGSSAPVNTALL